MPFLLFTITYLETNDNRVQVEYGLPVLSQDVQAHVSLQVDVRMVDLLHALHLGRVMGEVLVDLEVEIEAAAFVHALVRVDSELEVEDIVGIGEMCFHGRAEGELFEIYKHLSVCVAERMHGRVPFCARS